MQMFLNNLYRPFLFAEVESIEAGRKLWTQIAGQHAGQCLIGFMLVHDGEVVYRGNYVTDEC